MTRRQSKSPKFAKAPADLTGIRFGRWLVLKDAGMKVWHSAGQRRCQHLWLCRCDCGTVKEVYRANLVSGLSTGCSRCQRRGRATHAMCNTKLYRTWMGLKRRRELPRKWSDFDVFRKVVGDPPSREAHLRRYDLTKPHSATNTLWATPVQWRQARKKSEQAIVSQHPCLMKIHTAKSKNEVIRQVVAARKAGYSYAMVGIAAGLTRQRIQQIVKVASISHD